MFFEVLLSKGVNEKHDADERESGPGLNVIKFVFTFKDRYNK